MRALVILATVIGCQAVGEFTQPIVNGAADSGDAAVGYVGLCSATLIGRRTVLTAAHCAGVEGSAATFCTSPCNNYYQCAGTCVSGTVHVYSGYTGSGFDNDVAVISLSQDFTSLTGTAPLAISSAPPTVGQGLQLVGFGCDSAGCGPGQGNGIKRSGSTVVADVGATLFDFNGSQAQIGAGDWGGPAFTSSCEVGVMLGVSGGLYQLLRVDAKVSWVQSVSGDNTVVTCGQPVCGDGVCQSPETHASCPADCALCGDGVCQSPENGQTCPQDCGQCGNLANGTACDPGCCVGYGTCQNGLCTTQGGHCCNTHSCCFL